MEEMSWTDCEKNGEVLHRVKKEMNIQYNKKKEF
jgi:hypothetical protein